MLDPLFMHNYSVCFGCARGVGEERMRSLGGLGTEFGVFGWVNRPGLFERHTAHQQGLSQTAF